MVLNKKNLEKAFSPCKLGMRKQQHISTSTTANTTSPTSNIKVYVRVRPVNQRENGNSSISKVVKICDESSLIFDPDQGEDSFFFHGVQQKGRDLTKRTKKNMLFEFDKIFDDTVSNEEVYEASAKSIICSVFEGYNCSVFAYGATGAGKTFTMLGSQCQPGITYLTIVELLNYIEENKDTMDVNLAASYIEVYNENVRDLLSPKTPSLHLRDNGGQVAIAGLKVEEILDQQRLFYLLESGNCNRSQHPTDSNEESSRSHAIFQVHVRIVLKGSGKVKLAKLSMIDLAGSERGAATGCSGVRFKEGSNINKSLLALGNCINALADGLRHVPYRDSKLTRILKDSLGGNCKTVMVANIAPTSASFEDTYNTLKYALRARSIKSKLSKNILQESLSVHQYRRIIQQLEEKIFKYEKGDNLQMPDDGEWVKEIESVMLEKMGLNEKLLVLQGEQKMIEWRLKAQTLRLAQLDSPDTLGMNRLNTRMSQLKARGQSILERKGELLPALEANSVRERLLLDKIAMSNFAPFLQPTLEMWKEKIKSMEVKLENVHKEKLLRVECREAESQRGAKEALLPLCREMYKLLRAHNHITQPLKESYEMAMRTLDGIKAVSWDSEEEENCQNGRSHLTKLYLDEPHRKMETDEEFVGGPATERLGTPLKPRNTAPSTNITTISTIIKGKKVLAMRTGTAKSKIMINKENFGPMPAIQKFPSSGGSSFKMNHIKKVTLPKNSVLTVKPTLSKPLLAGMRKATTVNNQTRTLQDIRRKQK